MNAIVFSAVWGVCMMLSGLLTTNRTIVRGLALGGASLLLVVSILELQNIVLFPFDSRGMLETDNFSLLFLCTAYGSTLLYFLLSGADLNRVGRDLSDYYALIFFVLCGIAIASTYDSLLLLFLGIEIISIPLYILTGSDKTNLKGNEASLKYLLMGAFSTGIMLLGIALIYGSTGSFDLDIVAAKAANPDPLQMAGLLLLLFSLAFKVSAAPFHFWTPDVYDGAPTVFTSFMATIVKAGAFIAFIRLFREGFAASQAQWQLIVAIIAAATLLIGNITAVFQQSVKRMLAYSSISQAGFMLFAIVALNSMAIEGLIYYTLAYSLATIGAFAILARMEDYTFEGFNGFAKHHPGLAAAMAVFMLSLAGIPATAGFMGKFYMLSAAVGSRGVMWLVILGILCAAISVYYYFRVIQAMYFREGQPQAIGASGRFRLLVGLTAVLIVLLGLFPQWLIEKMYLFF